MDTLTSLTAEKQRLEVLESVIDAGMQTFVHVGNALLEIRDGRLYRQAHATFEDYCRERWGMHRSRAYQLIEAAETVSNLSTIVDIVPATESQARPLTVLEPAQQREAWQRAVETAPNGKVTAAHVESVVNEYRRPEPLPEPEPAFDWADDNDESLTDDDMQVMQPEPSRPHVSFNSGNNEWYTPAEYIEAARKVMGRIDLDPASSDIANQTIRAVTYYTAEDDGLSHHWRGNVWMNPPYAGELIGKFASKLIYHVTECDVRQAIILVNNATETTWFQEMIDEATAVVFPRSRVRFWKPDGTLGAPLQGQAIIYIGQHADAFLSEFSRFGWGANVYEL
jgi:phage N-6-adenine-methyltransferase